MNACRCAPVGAILFENWCECVCMSVSTHTYVVVIWYLDGRSDLFKAMFVHTHVPARSREPDKGPLKLSGD